MQVATGKSVLNGIAIGKIKVYTPPKVVISESLVEDTEAELARFDEAREKAIDQQNALSMQERKVRKFSRYML